MRHHGVIGIVFAASGLVFGSVLLAGCGTDVKDGSQVQISEETKAQVQDMRNMYKDMGKDKRKN